MINIAKRNGLGRLMDKVAIVTGGGTGIGEAANVYCFLASDEASFVTGALYTVDGGISTAKGAVGMQTPKNLRKPPKGTLDLSHSQDGLENKGVHVIAP